MKILSQKRKKKKLFSKSIIYWNILKLKCSIYNKKNMECRNEIMNSYDFPSKVHIVKYALNQ